MDKIISLFKRDYYAAGKWDLDIQVDHLARLAEYYLQKYEKYRMWTDCLKAHALFNSCGARRPGLQGWCERAFMVQQVYWQGSSSVTSVTFDQQQSLTSKLKQELEDIRNCSRESLKCAADIPTKCLDSQESKRKFIDQVELSSTDCTARLIGLSRVVVAESLSMLQQKPPCSFTAVAIGSLARGEATPYSDLEYLFLVEFLSPDVVNYFEQLAMTTYFVIGNLQETKLSYMAIDELEGWFDDKATNGFKIDGLAPGAGNIPTGNGSPGSKNHFIVTPESLANRYKHVLNNPNEKEALRGDFTAMLTYMESIGVFNLSGQLSNKRGPAQRKNFFQRISIC